MSVVGLVGYSMSRLQPCILRCTEGDVDRRDAAVRATRSIRRRDRGGVAAPQATIHTRKRSPLSRQEPLHSIKWIKILNYFHKNLANHVSVTNKTYKNTEVTKNILNKLFFKVKKIGYVRKKGFYFVSFEILDSFSCLVSLW